MTGGEGADKGGGRGSVIAHTLPTLNTYTLTPTSHSCCSVEGGGGGRGGGVEGEGGVEGSVMAHTLPTLNTYTLLPLHLTAVLWSLDNDVLSKHIHLHL